MTNLEKYLPELIAKEMGCRVQELRLNGAYELCDNKNCEFCFERNLRWLSAEYNNEDEGADCCICVNSHEIAGKPYLCYCDWEHQITPFGLVATKKCEGYKKRE